MKNILYIFLLALIGIFIDVRAAFLTLGAFLLIYILIRIFYQKDELTASLYNNVFYVNIAYVLACDVYMKLCGYNYLLTYDTDHIILPRLIEYLNSSPSYFQVLSNIWSDYSFFDRFQAGYYTYMSGWGWIANNINSELYYTIQLSHLSICALIPVFVYHLLRTWISDNRKAYKYALVIGLGSILFYYSSTILRDGLICVMMLYVYNLCNKEFSYWGLIKIIIALYIISTFRIESGLVSVLFVPIYFVSKSKQSSMVIRVCMGLLILLGVGFYLLSNYMGEISKVYQDNYEYYSEGVTEGRGIIASLQRLPPLIGDFLSIIYTALNPIPFWAKLLEGYDPSRPECYNMMNFPIAIATFFNTYIVVYLIQFLSRRRLVQHANLHSLYLLMVPGSIIMILQSAVVAQRRIMSVYVLFYILWAVVHFNSSNDENRKAFIYSIVIFTLLQFASFFI